MTEKQLDAMAKRKERIAKTLGMLRALRKGTGDVDYAKAMSVISYDLGVREGKVREYFTMLAGLGQIAVEKGVITFKQEGGE